ncbi:sigma-70 family RNA polymerase sigma factor [Herbiconiux sp. CPCC 205763]|uniref:RNA polymerase sigma factor n=1 Tax=Herbiconiux aconitum TaxID=2970913 RepID=A0ABT2GVE5_9MICO|nr:sigma-70 family RNA polymerase sigma factor [Herbiconiux aconitum]MCS5720175.1 sigma-70 family RNA polymerase sigma factor [Herbiconiux aconitum]
MTDDGLRHLSAAGDRILAGRAADGDVRAFEVLVRRYSRLMRAYAQRVLGSNSDVDDVVQEAFVQAWRKLPELDDLDAVKSWLMRIVANRSFDVIRRRREHDDINEHDQPAPPQDSPEAQAEKLSLEQALDGALSRLPDEQRRCWVLREIGGYSYLDIGRELALPSSTVRGLIARARKNLIRDMEEWR